MIAKFSPPTVKGLELKIVFGTEAHMYNDISCDGMQLRLTRTLTLTPTPTLTLTPTPTLTLTLTRCGRALVGASHAAAHPPRAAAAAARPALRARPPRYA